METIILKTFSSFSAIVILGMLLIGVPLLSTQGVEIKKRIIFIIIIDAFIIGIISQAILNLK